MINSLSQHIRRFFAFLHQYSLLTGIIIWCLAVGVGIIWYTIASTVSPSAPASASSKNQVPDQAYSPEQSLTGDRNLPIYNVSTSEHRVALSFDAAWGNEDTRTILGILKEHNIHVTFFMTGGWVCAYPEDVKAIYEAGHDLGNHSENHKEMSKLDAEEITEELMSVHNRVKELTGFEMSLFRPPYGDYDNDLILTADQCGYYTIQWNVDSLDWKDYGADDIVEKVTNHKNLKDGSIILMHNGAKYTAQALDRVITGLEAKGYELVPISELIIKDNFHMDPDGTQCPDSETSPTP